MPDICRLQVASPSSSTSSSIILSTTLEGEQRGAVRLVHGGENLLGTKRIGSFVDYHIDEQTLGLRRRQQEGRQEGRKAGRRAAEVVLD